MFCSAESFLFDYYSLRTLHILSYAQLELLVRDSKAQVQPAKDEASTLAKFGCVGFIGPWGSGPSIEVVKILSVPSIDRATIGYSASSPELGKTIFSNYVRTNPSVHTKAELAAKLIKGTLV